MTTKTELQQEIATLEAKLQEFKQQLNNYKEITIENASPGDVLEDGSIVVKKENGLALLAGPASVEIECQWRKEFPYVFEKLNEQGFISSQWFVPTKEQLNLAYQNPEVRKHFTATRYWSSTEVSVNASSAQFFNGSGINSGSKTSTHCVRPFRCVVF
jgi:hypothetical protein